MSRAYTEDEVAKMYVEHFRQMATYWANLPEVNRTLTVEDSCQGLVHSILATLDGCSLDLPAVDLKLSVAKEDKKFLTTKGLIGINQG